MGYAVLALVLLVTGQLCSSQLQVSLDLNTYVDQLFDSLRPWILQTLNPIPLPDFKIGISQGLNIGSLSLTNGGLYNLDLLQRYGDVSLEFVSLLETSNVSLGLKLPELTVGYDYKVGIFLVPIKGSVNGTFKDAGASISLGFDLVNLLQLQDFKANTGTIILNFRGLILVDWLLGTVTTILINLFKDIITQFLENDIRSAIEEVIVQVNVILKPLGDAAQLLPISVVDKIFRDVLANKFAAA